MSEKPVVRKTFLEIVSPDSSRTSARINESPFFIGRGSGTGNHLQLHDSRVSRRAAALICEAGSYFVEDRGQRGGVFVGGRKIVRCPLKDGDVITFGLDSPYEITFRLSAPDASVRQLLTRIEKITHSDSQASGLSKVNLILEAAMLLHSQLPLDAVLETMLDHAIAITRADRGLLLEPDPAGSVRTRLARGSGGLPLASQSLFPSQTALHHALEQQRSIITEDLNQAHANLQGAQSIVAQGLRTIVAIPLYTTTRATFGGKPKARDLLGVIYLDSRRSAAFSALDRQILDALGSEAASILENAQLVERERQRQRLEQELNIARGIQQALLPRGFRDFPYLAVTGSNSSCLAVGGDYFDVFPLQDGRTAFLVADVSGKGLGAALLTTMLQGALSALTIGADPARVFNHINSFLCEHTEVGRYATIFFGIIDPSGRVEFINAGHPSPLLLRGGEVTEPFTEGSTPVGLIPQAQYVAARAQLQPEDTLVLFSDGVTEAMDPDEEMFEICRLREVLSGRQDASIDLLQKEILDSVRSFTRGAQQADDVTLLLIRYRPAL